jgi:hypothetical protein
VTVELTPYLAEFVAEARELDRRRLLTTFRPNLTLDYRAGEGGMRDLSERPDVEDFRSFVMGLRLFWMKGEKFYMERVYDAAAAHLAGTDRAERLAESRASWQRNEGVGSFQYATRRPDGTETALTNRQIADRFINGLYLHRRDADKRKWVLGLDQFSRSLMEHAFADYLYSYAGEVFTVAVLLDPDTPMPPSGPAMR